MKPTHRKPTHPGAYLRTIVLPAVNLTQQEIAQEVSSVTDKTKQDELIAIGVRLWSDIGIWNEMLAERYMLQSIIQQCFSLDSSFKNCRN